MAKKTRTDEMEIPTPTEKTTKKMKASQPAPDFAPTLEEKPKKAKASKSAKTANIEAPTAADNEKNTSLPSRKAKKENRKEYERYSPAANQGLTNEQVEQRLADGLNNKSAKKYSKTYRSIFIGNICTFFNQTIRC